jgi:hypothetical protein
MLTIALCASRRDCALFYKSLAGTGVTSRSISASGS